MPHDVVGDMKAETGDLAGVVVFRPTPMRDTRGSFSRTFDAEAASRAGIRVETLVQDSQSRSRCGVVRGLHFRTDGGEGKLVRCSYGRIFDVAVDLRPRSTTFGAKQVIVLDDQEHVSVWLPPGLAHGFQAMTDVADVHYRIDRPFLPGVDGCIRWDDPDLAIDWPLPPTQISDKDRSAPFLADITDQIPTWFAAL